MGLWGAAQAIAAGLRRACRRGGWSMCCALSSPTADAFGAVFVAEAALFLVAAGLMALRGSSTARACARRLATSFRENDHDL